MTSTVALAVPCRTDEPELGRTLTTLWAGLESAGAGDAPTLVCLNGAGSERSRAAEDLRRAAAASGRTVKVGDAAADVTIALRDVVALTTSRTGKAMAWNVLRQRCPAEVVVFADADVEVGPDAVALLLRALARTPHAIVASPKTTCAPRATAFERIMAAPYGIDFPNLSGQLYAARSASLPAAMPDDLIEPERWLELALGRDRVVREPAARVVVRLPATLRDFFRQRVRIEMGKVQLAREHPDLLARGNPQPRLGAAVRALGMADLVRLAVYLALREVAHAAARRRYGRQTTAEAWVQASSTKQWSA